MACFLVPAAEAVVTTVIGKVMDSKEQHSAHTEEAVEATAKVPFSRKMKWLNNLLWGGSALLAYEHVWHGEVIPRFPFLTAAADPASAGEMLHEMATAGVSMAVLCTLVWLGMLGVSALLEKRERKAVPAQR